MPPTQRQNTTEDTTEDKVSLHDRLDNISASIGHDATAVAVRELLEIVREVTPDAKLGKRTLDPATGEAKVEDE